MIPGSIFCSLLIPLQDRREALEDHGGAEHPLQKQLDGAGGPRDLGLPDGADRVRTRQQLGAGADFEDFIDFGITYSGGKLQEKY
jgi:hypothetical protein